MERKFGGETWESGLSGRLVRNWIMILGWKPSLRLRSELNEFRVVFSDEFWC
jgi:hypothetical protein